MIHIERSYRQLHLWPSLHAAVDVFLRRRAAGAEPYELVWRLIHVWECATISMAAAGTARLIMDAPGGSVARQLRERLHGRVWSEDNAELVSGQGALHGSIDKWIEILDFVGTAGKSAQDGSFLKFLGEWLDDAENTPIDVSNLVSNWRRACDVPDGMYDGSSPLAPRYAFRLVNSFRNRFAHVPFPYDPIQSVFGGLLAATDALFKNSANPRSPLAGVILYRNHAIVGSTTQSFPSQEETARFGHGWSSKSGPVEVWPAEPFVYVDQMARPYLLTRLRNAEGGLLEYTRYLAESNAVVLISNSESLKTIPVPQEREYKGEQQEKGDQLKGDVGGGVEEMESALDHLRQRRFDDAIATLEALTKKRPDYHVGWLRLGVAQRERAVELMKVDSHATNDERVSMLLSSSVASLTRASGHIQPGYRAESEYQLSKTFFRLWKHGSDPMYLDKAAERAASALRSAAEARYETWLEFLLERKAALAVRSTADAAENAV